MNLPFLFILCCLCLLCIGYTFNQYKKAIPRRNVVLASAFIVSISAFTLIKHHTFPEANQKIFLNTDYHVIEHLGYSFDKSIRIADDKSDKSLWSNIDGDLLLQDSGINKVVLTAKNIFTPIYIKTDSAQTFHLLNPAYTTGIADTLIIQKGSRTLLRLQIAVENENHTNYSVAFSDTTDLVPLKFKKTLKKGFPILDLIHTSDTLTVPKELDLLLVDTWLCRKILGDFESPLMLMPSSSLFKDNSVHVAGHEKTPQAFKAYIQYGGSFISGVDDLLGDVYIVKKGALFFRMPDRYHLKSDGAAGTAHTLLITSDQEKFEQTGLKGGYFFDRFDKITNLNHIWAELEYTEASANESLKFRINDYNNHEGTIDSLIYTANQSIQVRTKQKGISWIVQIDDLRATFPIKPAYLYWFVCFFWITFISVMLYNGLENATIVEACTYFVIFPFLLTRLLIHWRIGVFPPLENLGFKQWNALREARSFYVVIITCAVFALIRFFFIQRFRDADLFLKVERIFKRYLQNLAKNSSEICQGKNLNIIEQSIRTVYGWLVRSYQSENLWKYILLHSITLVSLKALLKGVDYIVDTERFENIALPITLYFIFDFIHNIWDENQREIEFRWVNRAITTIYLAVSDAGFSIVFLLFLLFSAALEKFIFLKQQKNSNRNGLQVNMKPFLILLLIFFIVTIFNTNIIVYVFELLEYSPDGCALIAIVSLGWLMKKFVQILIDKDTKWIENFTFNFKGKLFKFNQYFIHFIIGFLSVVYLLGIALDIPQKTIDKFIYIKYRAAIHTSSIDQILPTIQFESRDIDKIREASQNQWFINTYIHADRADSLFYDNAILNMQPHFNQGVSYSTQTTDLVTSRYLITEYPSGTMYSMIGLLIIFAAIYAAQYSIRQVNKTTHSIIILILTAALFVWLTATNRFTFFGQDFPLVSVTSVFAVVFYVGLFLFVIVSANSENRTLRNTNFLLNVFKQLIPFIIVSIIISLTGFFRDLKIKDEFFNMSELVDEISTRISSVNKRFDTFQANLEKDIDKNEKNLDQLVQRFIIEEINETQHPEIKNALFWKSVLENLKTYNTAQLRNPDNILHIVRKYSGEKTWDWEFKVNQRYFLVKPPYFEKRQWKGHLYGGESHKGWVTINRNTDELTQNFEEGRAHLIGTSNTKTGQPSQQNIQFAVIPPTWKKDSTASLILLLELSNYSTEKIDIRNAISPKITLKKGTGAILLKNDDEISYLVKGSAKSYKFTNQYHSYLMRNLWINGSQRMFFPLGEKCLWAYHFSNATKKAFSQRDTDLKKSKQISLDLELTSKLATLVIEHRDSYKGDSLGEKRMVSARIGITVIDSEGRIRAISDFDFNNPKGINPNKWSSFAELRQYLYLDQRRKRDRDLLGNINILKLPLGPGSSIKPIVYTAVTSQSASIPWRQLRQIESNPPDSIYFKDDDKKWLYQYSRLRLHDRTVNLKKRKKTGWLLNNSEFLSYSPHDYLVHSKNIYHSMVVYLGSYNRATLREKQFLDTGNSQSVPCFTLGDGKIVTFSPAQAPQNTDKDAVNFFGNDYSVMSEGLFNNFNLVTRTTATSALEDIDVGSDSIFLKNRGNAYFAFPETSNFLQTDRASTKQEGFSKAIIQTSLGGDPINVTPLKMAEMFGNLAKFDKSFQATLRDKIEPYRSKGFDTDPEWNENYHQFAQSNIYIPLQDVLSEGTAEKLGKKLYASDINKLYYYAKTGTIGSIGEGGKKTLYSIDGDFNIKRKLQDKLNDKLLMLIISKNDLSKLSIQQQATNPFYVVYITQINFGDHDWDLIHKIIQGVESSVIFKNFMNKSDISHEKN
jgi:cell division protein FtsI/penicillin-binding protein 2